MLEKCVCSFKHYIYLKLINLWTYGKIDKIITSKIQNCLFECNLKSLRIVHYAFRERNLYTRSVRKVSGLPLYLCAIVFERPLRGMNVNSKDSKTYRLLGDICRTNSSCAACLFTKLFLSSVDIVVVKND